MSLTPKAGCCKGGRFPGRPVAWPRPEDPGLETILRADRTFGYNYKTPGSYQGDDERWTMDGDTLTLNWNGGYCLDTFPMHGWGSGTVVGTQSVNNRRIVFTRVE